MEIFGSAYDLLIGYMAPFLFVLTIVVFFHELGHFAVARWCNVKVDAFSVGFGRELFGWYDKHGTRWKVSLIPLGGYVKFAGDENAASVPDREYIASMSEEERRTAFIAKPVWQRAAIVAAGPIANFILAVIIFAGIFMAYGKPQLLPVVSTVIEGSAAETAGIQTGDRILSINDKPLSYFEDLKWTVRHNPDQPLVLGIERDGAELTATVVPVYVTDVNQFGVEYREPRIGVAIASDENTRILKQLGVGGALWEGVLRTYKIIYDTINFIGEMFAGEQSPQQLGGPIQIAQVSGTVAQFGLIELISLAGFLSVSIGFINLLPIPILDGGHLVFYAAEAIRGKPLNEKVQEVGFRIGLGLVLMLMVFATWNDIWRLMSL
ncbi:RIP metalloprotease RseP [Roseibium alexandrii]|uniref:Zinc metalloprotease n=2 Tax=Roseibium alexandrii TaxID=388408 RepID=A0A0M7ADN5_9HYPH|nr:RIP metalloprotease RseP [Roseibium alexandrii]EEE45224.1 putative membrane-associated Zn-dependent protease 1 [Roseibium alexandrii DFL-11]CTQ73198.1 Metalloprotease MmpA [Roseibium alexandrii]